VKDLLKVESPEILMLQETIIGEVLLDLSRMKWKIKEGKVVSARGTSRGLATIWIEDLFQREISFETHHWIYTELCHKTSKITIALFNL
jgi:hypothetical protein